VKDLLVVVRDGDLLNKTLATISYNRLGAKTNQQVTVCDGWIEGIELAKKSGAGTILFVDSGTVFTDWAQWLQELQKYPHYGLIGHIVWKTDRDFYPWLHEQCWLIDQDLLAALDFSSKNLSYPCPVRSEKNIHDDYTPLYLKPDLDSKCQHESVHFTQVMIAAQLARGRSVINWHQKIRSIKHYLHARNPLQNQIWEASRKEYLDLAENQFWILNNEAIQFYHGRHQLSPAAGLHWILNICQPSIQEMDIIDISNRQIEFARHLWTNWDGKDYGQQVVDFIRTNQLIHYEIDRANLDKITRLKLKNPSNLKRYVNERFDQLAPADFVQLWQLARQTKTARFQVGNLIDWVIQNGISTIDAVWLSNIVDYKWTLLNSSKQDIVKFKEILQNHG